MNKRKRDQEQDNEIRILSRIDQLDRAPDQVLKFIILEQQKIIHSKDQIIQNQSQKLQKYRQDLDRMVYCKFGQHYVESYSYFCQKCIKVHKEHNDN